MLACPASWRSRALPVAIALILPACEPAPSYDVELSAACETIPEPPAVGSVEVACLLTGRGGQPIDARTLNAEAIMAHPGMQAVIGDVREVAPGRYKTRLNLTMAGDWFLILTGETSSGSRFEETVDLPGVQPE